MQPEQDPARNSQVTMRSSSAYAEISSGVAPPVPAAAVRQQSYYEAVRRNGATADANPMNFVNSASTANLVDELTCPKEFYQVRNHHMYPIVEDEQQQEVDKQSKMISRGAYLLIIAICVVSVCLAIFCCVLTINMQKKVETLEKRFGQRQPTSSAQGSNPRNVMCLPCDDIKQGPFPEDNEALSTLDKIFENGTEICCAKSPEQVSTLFDLFTKRKITGKCTEETHGNCSSSSGTPPPPPSKPTQKAISAHLQIGKQTSGGPDIQPIRNWLNDRTLTHLDGIEIRKDRLIVPETGVYFIYSQAGFLIYYDSTHPVSAHEQSVFHYVYRYNARLPNNGVQEMMRSDMSQCWEQNKSFTRYTSYVGSAIKLEKNDELYVEVSNFSSLVIDGSVTFFGMYLIR